MLTTQHSQNLEPLKIALMGGTFDPVHTAHIQIAQRAYEALSLDTVYFIPNSQSPIKEQGPRASDAQRLAMLNLALKEYPKFVIDDLEIKRGGLSYAYETAEYFLERYPNSELFWIIGADQFGDLGRWRKIELLSKLLTFLVFKRKSKQLNPPDVPNLQFSLIESQLLEVSSSEIRAQYAKNRGSTGMLSEPVEAFILEQGLYKQNG